MVAVVAAERGEGGQGQQVLAQRAVDDVAERGVEAALLELPERADHPLARPHGVAGRSRVCGPGLTRGRIGQIAMRVAPVLSTVTLSGDGLPAPLTPASTQSGW